MSRYLIAAALVCCASMASAQSLGDLVRAAERAIGGSGKTKSGQIGATQYSVAPTAADRASLATALDRATATRTPASQALREARPVAERLLMTLGCATDRRALHALNRERLTPQTYSTSVGDEWNYTAMGIKDHMTHDRRQCMQVVRISDVERKTLNALSLRAHYVSPSSGEARSVPLTFRLMDGTWLIDHIAWFS